MTEDVLNSCNFYSNYDLKDSYFALKTHTIYANIDNLTNKNATNFFVCTLILNSFRIYIATCFFFVWLFFFNLLPVTGHFSDSQLAIRFDDCFFSHFKTYMVFPTTTEQQSEPKLYIYFFLNKTRSFILQQRNWKNSASKLECLHVDTPIGVWTNFQLLMRNVNTFKCETTISICTYDKRKTVMYMFLFAEK